jgi:hypothetical protein
MVYKSEIKRFAKKVIPKRYHSIIKAIVLEPIKSWRRLVHANRISNVPEVNSNVLPKAHVKDIMKEIETRLDCLKNSSSN